MAQILEAPIHRERLSRVDEQILVLLEHRHLPMEQVVALADADESEAVSSVSRLIAHGYVELVILQYPWGVEFELQPIDQTTG